MALCSFSIADPDNFYSGVGSRRCQDLATLSLMTRIARAMAHYGLILRSGAADGPDTAFEQGAPRDRRRIYVPNERFGDRAKGSVIVPKQVNLIRWLKACSIAEQYHFLGRRMPQDIRDLMGRNVYQVLGDDLATPSRFLVCDAPFPEFDEAGRVVNVDGGTGMAVRLAAAHGIPVYLLSIPEHRQVMEDICAAHEAGLPMPALECWQPPAPPVAALMRP